MAIAINGTGPVTGVTSISGLSAGGIPAGAATPLQSVVRVNTTNGWGSTNTVIRRFSSVVTNVGSDITYADSATLGASFTINTTGVYAIGYTDTFDSAINYGISLNSSQLTTGILSITAADRLCAMSTGGAGYIGHLGSTLYLTAGAVIRPHTSAATATNNAACQFTITRVA